MALQVAEPLRTEHHHRDKRRVALGSVLAAALMTVMKLIAGLLTGSLGLLSEAAHSALDLVASLLTFLSVRLSDKPADEDHTYGHGKVENLAAFAEVFLMLASCVWIIRAAVLRLFASHFGEPAFELRPSIWAFLVLGFSVAVDFTRSRALRRVARRTDSAALEADALHFGTDIWSSIAVLIGLCAASLGLYLQQAWLQMADPIAAIIVSLIILRVTWRLGRQTVNALMDSAPASDRRRIISAIRTVPGVLDVDSVRIRKAGSSFFADLRLGFARNLTFQRSEEVTRDVTAAVRSVLPGADVTVQGTPRASLAESIFDRIRAVAARQNLSIHDVSVQQDESKLHLELHVELPEAMPLRGAHDFVTRLESEMRAEVPELASILTHIESEPATIEKRSLESDRALERQLRQAAHEIPEVVDIHDILVGRAGEHLQLSCHCTLPDHLPMSRVHEIITTLEARFKSEVPEAYRVLIHPEPATDNRR